MARKGLGQGLGALLGDLEDEAPVRGTGAKEITRLGVDKMAPSPFQPRQQFDPEALEQLASSLENSGMLQPILVRPNAAQDGHYEIIAGERRWRAAQIARLHEVPVVVRALDDRQTLEAAVLENVQRQDLSAIEEARGYLRLVQDFGYSAHEVAETIGKSRPHVANMLRLLELPENVQKLVDSGKISAGHARAIIGQPNVQDLARQVLEKGLSVRQLEDVVRKQKQQSENDLDGGTKPRNGASVTPKVAKKDPDTLSAEQQLAEILGLPVSIDQMDGKGSITVGYSDFEQLDELLRRLGMYD